MPGSPTPTLLQYAEIVDVDMSDSNDVNFADVEDYGHRVIIEMDRVAINNYLGWQRSVGDARPFAKLDSSKEAAFKGALEYSLSAGFVDVDGVTSGLHFGTANLDTNTDPRLRANGVSANDIPLSFILYKLYGNSSVQTLDNIFNLQDAHGMLDNTTVATAIINSFKAAETSALDTMFRDLLTADPHRFFNTSGVPEMGIFETNADVSASGTWKIIENDVLEIKTKFVFHSQISKRGTAGREHLLSQINSAENQQIVIRPDDYFYVRLQIKAVGDFGTVPSAPLLTRTFAAPASTEKALNIYFTQPSDGGSAVTNYKYSLNGKKYITFEPPQTSSPLMVENLINATSYNIAIKAVNIVGDSDPVSTIGFPGVPDYVTSLTTISGDGSVLLEFLAPETNGGFAITKYQYSVNGGASYTDMVGSIPSINESGKLYYNVSGLTNGQTYSFKVRAFNQNGNGLQSVAVSATPSGVPSAPTSLVATKGDSSIQIAFAAGADGGSALTNYKYSLDGTTYVAFSPVVTSSPLTISGLTNGTAYTVYLKAVNANGDSAASSSTSATPSTIPSVPTSVVAVRGDECATISWTQESTGGSPIQNYVITGRPSVGDVDTVEIVTENPYTLPIGSLVNGVSYTFTVVAINANGSSAASSASNAVVPARASDAPAGLGATIGDGSLQVSFSVEYSGGVPITNYKYSLDGTTYVAFSPAVTSSPVTISGLTNGTAYTVYLKAVNEMGDSAASSPISATPATVPSVPAITNVVGGNAEATVSFSESTSNGGAAITSYTVVSSPDSVSVSGTSSPMTLTGLTNGTAYTFSVYATNVAGNSSSSSSSAAVTPSTVPDAPTNVLAEIIDGVVTVSFTGPVSNGGSSILSYTVTSSPDGITATSTSTSIAVSGLTFGGTYTFTAIATNANGNSAVSTPSATVTLASAPSAPTDLVATAGDASISIAFTAGSNGGSALTNYKYSLDGTTYVAFSPAVTSSPVTISGLAIGTEYTVYLKAVNIAGDSAASSSVSATPIYMPPTSATNKSISMFDVATYGAAPTGNVNSLPTDASFSFKFFGTEYGQGNTGDQGISFASNNVLGFGIPSTVAPYEATSGKGILLGSETRILDTTYSLPVYTSGDFKIQTYFISFRNSAASVTSGEGQIQLRLIKNNVNGLQFIEVSIIKGSGTKMGGAILTTGAWNITDGSSFKGTFGSTFATVFPEDKTSFVLSSDANGANWLFTNNYKMDLEESPLTKKLAVVDWHNALTGNMIGNFSSSSIRSITNDSNNNIYITGFYNGSLSSLYLGNFVSTPQPNLSSVSLSATSSNTAYLAKYDASGIAQWATKIDGTGTDNGFSVATDSTGNIYITGSYTSTSAVSLNNSITLPATATSSAAFLVKYDTSGLAQWATSINGTSNDIGYSVVTDSTGNVYIAGQYMSTSTVPLNNGITLPLVSSSAAFLVKYDTSGLAQWATSINGTGTDIGYSVTTDSIGNVYISGNYTSSNSVLLNNGVTLPAASTAAVFLVKYNTSGLAQWANRIDGTGSDNGYSVATDSTGNVYIAGNYVSSTVFTLNNGVTLPAASTGAAFLVKYNVNGLAQWATTVDGTSIDNGYSVTIDSTGNIYLAGQYASTTSIITLNNGITLPVVSNSAAFLAKYNANGLAQWATTVDGTAIDIGYTVKTDTSGNIYFGGSIASSNAPISFKDATNTNIISLQNMGGSYGFICKYNAQGTPISYSILGYGTMSYAINTVDYDMDNNVYIGGTYTSILQTTLKDASGNNTDVILPYTYNSNSYIVKYNSSGTPLLAFNISNQATTINAIKVDSNNYIYIEGNYNSNSIVTLNNNITLPVTSSLAAFLAKYDANGLAQWATTVDGISGDYGYSVAIDSIGNVYISGQYTSTSIVPLNNSITLPITSFGAAFLVKYDANGLAQWATKIDGTGNDNGNYVTTDSIGNVYISGSYTSTSAVSLNNSITLPLVSSSAAFLVKYNASGLAQWATKIDGTNNDNGQSVATDSIGNVYISGSYLSTSIVPLNNGITLPITNSIAAFLAKYDANGLAQWATKIDGIGADNGYSVTTDSIGNVYIAGNYNNTSIVTLNNNITLPITTSSAAFLAKYDASGLAQWATSVDGTGLNDAVNQIKVDANGNVFIGCSISTSSSAINIKNAGYVAQYDSPLNISTLVPTGLLVKYNQI
jgi:hypothetical protein